MTLIQHKFSKTAGIAPTSLADGEVAINSTDGIMYWNDATGVVRATPLKNVSTFSRAAVADTNYVAQASDRYIAIISITANRTITLPRASAVPSGTSVRIADEGGALSSTKNITVGIAATPNGGVADTIDGQGQVTLSSAYSGMLLLSDGVNRWTYEVQAISTGGTGATTAAGALVNLGAAGRGANTDITSLGGLTARPSWAGYVPWDSNNLIATAVDGIVGRGTLWGSGNLTANAAWSILGYKPAVNYWSNAHNIGLSYDGSNFQSIIDGGFLGTMWDSHNFNPGGKLNNDGGATVAGFNGGNANRPYISGSSYRDLAYSVTSDARGIGLDGFSNPYFYVPDSNTYVIACRSTGDHRYNWRWNGSTAVFGVDNSEFGMQLSSDLRLKNVRGEIDADEALDKLLGLRPTAYEWNEKHELLNERPGERYGFIAQELEQVLPTVVHQGPELDGGEPGYLLLTGDASIQLCALLVKSLVKLREEFHDVEQRLKVLEGKNNG